MPKFKLDPNPSFSIFMIKYRYIAIALATIICTIAIQSSSLFVIAATTEPVRSPALVTELKMPSAPALETTFDLPSRLDRTPINSEDTHLPPDNHIDLSNMTID
jgi:hypothetical protein